MEDLLASAMVDEPFMSPLPPLREEDARSTDSFQYICLDEEPEEELKLEDLAEITVHREVVIQEHFTVCCDFFLLIYTVFFQNSNF